VSKTPKAGEAPRESTDIQVTFGLNVRTARLRLDMSQETLSDLTGISRTHIPRIERGAVNPSLENCQNLAKALKVRLADLLLSPDEFANQVEDTLQTSGPLPVREGVLAIEIPERSAFDVARAVAIRIGRAVHLIDPLSREIRAVVTG
jgi:transcriptional regulator with XRE-family HTH domain